MAATGQRWTSTGFITQKSYLGRKVHSALALLPAYVISVAGGRAELLQEVECHRHWATVGRNGKKQMTPQCEVCIRQMWEGMHGSTDHGKRLFVNSDPYLQPNILQKMRSTKATLVWRTSRPYSCILSYFELLHWLQDGCPPPPNFRFEDWFTNVKSQVSISTLLVTMQVL